MIAARGATTDGQAASTHAIKTRSRSKPDTAAALVLKNIRARRDNHASVHAAILLHKVA